MYLHGTSQINQQGHLEIGGCDTVDLAKEFGTPLYIIDEQLVRAQMQDFQSAAKQAEIPFRVAYASKAFSTLAMCRIADEEGLLLDVVSSGELYTALQADFPAERIYFHGNNKTPDELAFALDADIRQFVVDNFVELTLLQRLAQEKEKSAHILLRVAPGVTGETHAYIQTGQEDTKFGFDLVSGQATEAVKQAIQSSHLVLEGFHCHLGSQIFEVDIFPTAIKRMAELIHTCEQEFGFRTQIFNVGGGFGIRYQPEDQPKPAAVYVQAISSAVKKHLSADHLPEIWIEPGRRLIGEAGTTLYTLGAMKHIPGIRKYVSVDGGMTDNIRPALYQAKYEAMLANRANDTEEEVVSVAGRCCESGDMLIWDCSLPIVQTGDLLAVSSTGAYNYSLANNYNRFPRPAVVFVNDGEADLIVQRESLQDIVANDLIPSRLQRNHVKTY